MSESNSSKNKAVSSNDDTNAKDSESQNVPSTNNIVHRESGYEKFAIIGGSGGATAQNTQGYERLAEH